MAPVSTQRPNPFGDDYANAVGALPGATEAWVDGLRKTARAVLETNGLPTRKTESWKYTSLNEVVKTPFVPAAKAEDVDVTSVPVTIPLLENALKIVLVNGVYRPDLSDSLAVEQDGVALESLSSLLRESPQDLKQVLGAVVKPGQSEIAALNTGYMEDGVVLRVDGGTELEVPVHVVSIGAAGAAPCLFHPRFTIALGQGAKAVFLESHVGLPGQPYLTNALTEVVLDAQSQLKHYTLIGDDSDAYHLGQTAVHVDQAADYSSFILSMGGKLVRREVRVNLHDLHARARVDGAYGLNGKQHSDIHSEIMHNAPDTVSHQIVKGVLGGLSHGVFQGRIHVDRCAQGTDGRQLHKALLLEKGPEVNCKPELEIYADDVQCAHGATTGELDKDHIFYLMSRGIAEPAARALLIEGFLDDVVFGIEHEGVQELVLKSVKSWLARQSSLVGGSQ